MKYNLNLITHTFNEEYLIYFFIKHYINQVDEAIVIDYSSTDSTLDIVRELAPHWRIIQSPYQ